MKYYIDACIWRDYAENRNDKFRPLGEWAFRFFKQIIENNDQIIISDLLIEELNEFYDNSKKLITIIPKKLIINKNMNLEKARIISKKYNCPVKDSAHAVIAKENNAIMVTRDNHFYNLVDYVIVKKPEDLI